ncbi:MAG: hypothetical protein B6I24_03250 [Bacteroidetes bacterium 4572_128]|nr:MAG: hypothetical protein B6I24_03250 [Bacteroidetes bacterium 4572_128]
MNFKIKNFFQKIAQNFNIFKFQNKKFIFKIRPKFDVETLEVKKETSNVMLKYFFQKIAQNFNFF